MMVGQTYTCLYCLEPDGYALRLDKKGRPYFLCDSCGARTFLRGERSLRGPTVLWGPLTEAIRAGRPDIAKVLLENPNG